MLYYIKHEIIGDYVHQIQEGIPIRYGFHKLFLSKFSIFISSFGFTYLMEYIHSAI